ncbi:MAG: MFS transporter [Nitratireductor sp.]|nr:MFS transporter [Nitratireductor sp.]
MQAIAVNSQPDSRYSWARLAVSVLAGTLTNIGMWAAILVLPAVQTEFGVDRADVSMAYTAVMAGFAAGNLLLGRLVDRYGIAPVLACCALILSASFALGALSGSIWTFTLLQFAVGFATAAGFGPLIADVSHWFVRRRGIAVAAAAAGNYLAGALWPQALKGIIAEQGWRAAFFFIAVVCLIGIIPLALMLRRRITHDASPAVGTAAFGTRSINLSPAMLQALLIAAGVGCCVAMSMPQVHIVAYCSDLGYGVTAGAEMLSTMLAAGIVSRLITGFIADYIGGVRTLLIGSVLQCLALFLYIPFDGLASLYVVSFVFGLSQGGIVPSYAIIVREYLPAREAGQRVGIVVTATVVGMALGGWMSGWIYDLTGSYAAAFPNGIAWNLMNIAVMLIVLMRTRNPGPVPA